MGIAAHRAIRKTALPKEVKPSERAAEPKPKPEGGGSQGSAHRDHHTGSHAFPPACADARIPASGMHLQWRAHARIPASGVLMQWRADARIPASGVHLQHGSQAWS